MTSYVGIDKTVPHIDLLKTPGRIGRVGHVGLGQSVLGKKRALEHQTGRPYRGLEVLRDLLPS